MDAYVLIILTYSRRLALVPWSSKMYTAKSESLRSRKSLQHTSWDNIVNPTVRPKSVHNPSLIDNFGGAFLLSIFLGDFVIGLRKIAFFLSFSVF